METFDSSSPSFLLDLGIAEVEVYLGLPFSTSEEATSAVASASILLKSILEVPTLGLTSEETRGFSFLYTSSILKVISVVPIFYLASFFFFELDLVGVFPLNFLGGTVVIDLTILGTEALVS